MRPTFVFAALVATTLPASAAPPPIVITSPAFAHQREMPSRYTCDGAGISPELRWTGVPDRTKSLVLFVTDPDAPDPDALKRHLWVHWVLYDIPPTAAGLAADVAPADLPAGTRQGINGWNKTGYGSPCPPSGRHRYFFRLFALDTELPDLKEPDRASLERAMTGHVIGTGFLIGTYAHR
jgi:Raf kinase inhibitor-like YbhB/YbcL family protein